MSPRRSLAEFKPLLIVQLQFRKSILSGFMNLRIFKEMRLSPGHKAVYFWETINFSFACRETIYI